MSVAIAKQTCFTSPSPVLFHLHCGPSIEWEKLLPIRTTRDSFHSVATPAIRSCLPSSHGYPSTRPQIILQGGFDGNKEREPAVHILGVSLRFDRHENMLRQLCMKMRKERHDGRKESRESMNNALFLHLEHQCLHATTLRFSPSISGSLHLTHRDTGTRREALRQRAVLRHWRKRRRWLPEAARPLSG